MRERRSARVTGVTLAIAVAAMVAAPQAALAHAGEERWHRTAYNAPGRCLEGADVQAHHYHRVDTFLARNGYAHGQSGCPPEPQYVDPNNIAKFIAYYKTRVWGTPGEICGYHGWYLNGVRDYKLEYLGQWDIWASGCNYGGGVNVWLSIDTWHYTVHNGAWQGRDFRPSTKHCHCP